MPSSNPEVAGGQLLANLLHFGRLLRRVGIRVSSQQIYHLAEGLTFIDLARKDDFYFAARSFLLHDAEKIDLFGRAFNLFWMRQVEWQAEFGVAAQKQLPGIPKDIPESDEALLSRQASSRPAPADEREPDPTADASITGTYSPVEILAHKDFADFSEEELEVARRFVQNLVWRLDRRLTRRQVRALKQAGRLDMRRAVRESMKFGGEILELPWRRRKRKPRPLVVLCDVSGSMERYSRLFLHFMYAMAQGFQRVELFVFGTRLTCITPALRHNDVDTAITKMSALVMDWSGGTRIGESLKTFNYKWARRKLGRGAVVILISDGWDRGDIDLLEVEISRLRRSVSRLIWLNPLSGAPGYQPLVRGIQAALPYVDDFLPFNNLLNLEQLALRLGSLG